MQKSTMKCGFPCDQEKEKDYPSVGRVVSEHYEVDPLLDLQSTLLPSRTPPLLLPLISESLAKQVLEPKHIVNSIFSVFIFCWFLLVLCCPRWDSRWQRK